MNRYPVILNIENHCSAAQQKQMARILKNILGGKETCLTFGERSFTFSVDQLVTKPLPNKDPTILPSPEDLKHKVLIRVRRKLLIEELFLCLFRVKKQQNRVHQKKELMMMILL